MKKHLLIVSLAAGAMLAACNKQYDVANLAQQDTGIVTNSYQAPTFAEPDGSRQLTGTPSENLKAIFEATGPGIITSMGRMNITDAQYAEIEAFTTKLVEGKASQKEKHETIFWWINGNVKYGQGDPDPYAVFKNKMCVCQGYANLLTVMCHTQGIPTVVVNGFLSTPELYGGHAWAYTYLDDAWEVSDPTNARYWSMSNTHEYSHLIPSEADVDLFADDYAVYRYYDYKVNVDRVTTTENPLIVPYSAGGFVINSFNPSVALPESITEIYIGENITTFGESDNMSLATSNYGQYLQAIYVDENNPQLSGHKGIVYRKNGNERQLYYIPNGMEFIELLPMEKVEKNTIYNHSSVKTIYFPEGTKVIESFAIENCPQLERVYIPQDADFHSDAIYGCPSDVEVIRGIPSSITPIIMD